MLNSEIITLSGRQFLSPHSHAQSARLVLPAGEVVLIVQFIQLALALIAENLPASQLVQSAAPANEYVPATQSVQTEAPAAEYVPAPQLVQAAELVCAVNPENLPASHARHPEAP